MKIRPLLGSVASVGLCVVTLGWVVACDDDDDDPKNSPITAEAGADGAPSPGTDAGDAGAAETSTTEPTPIDPAAAGTCRFVVDGAELIGTQVEGSGGFGTTASRSEDGFSVQCIASVGDVNHTLQISVAGVVEAGGSYTGVSGAPKAGEVYTQIQYSPIKSGSAPAFYRQTAGAKLAIATLDATTASGSFELAVSRDGVTKPIVGAFNLTLSE